MKPWQAVTAMLVILTIMIAAAPLFAILTGRW